MTDRPYKKLTGQGYGLFLNSRLWEGADHLLLVQSHRISESYRRFYYRDIQAIVVCRTKRGLVMSIVFGVLALAFGGGAAAAGGGTGIALGALGGIFLILALIEVLRGPTCKSTIRTAVQTQALAPLNRIRTARKVLSRIQPKIAAAQQSTQPP